MAVMVLGFFCLRIPGDFIFHPYHLFSSGKNETITFNLLVFAHLLLQSIQGKGAELLYTDDGKVVLPRPQSFSVLLQRVEVFAAAEHKCLDAVG